MRAVLLFLLPLVSACEDAGARTSTQWLGQPCDPSAAPGVMGSSVLVASSDASCGGQAACVFPVELGEEPCTSPRDCMPDGTCQSGTCVPTAALLDSRSMCATSCEISADCEPMEDTECEGGFTCTRVATVGPDCCTKQCVCVDDVDFVASEEIQMACVAGVQPGCCDQDPSPSACG